MLTAEDFLGEWRLTRQIDDRSGRQSGQLSGHAKISALAENALKYDEEGRLVLGEAPALQATRTYLWHVQPSAIDVRFADGREFHRFVPMGCNAGTDHPCGSDFYRVVYDFRQWPVWQSTWQVTGPRKDYVSVSRYDRT